MRRRPAQHHVRRRRQVIAGIERTAVEDGNAHRLEVVARGERHLQQRATVCFAGRAFDMESAARRPFIQRNVLDHSGRADGRLMLRRTNSDSGSPARYPRLHPAAEVWLTLGSAVR